MNFLRASGMYKNKILAMATISGIALASSTLARDLFQMTAADLGCQDLLVRIKPAQS